jgi:hypothetical protein
VYEICIEPLFRCGILPWNHSSPTWSLDERVALYVLFRISWTKVVGRLGEYKC